MTKQNEWACSEGCDLSSKPCEHLEKLLPPMRDKKVPYADLSNHTQDVFAVYRPSFDLKEFQDLMKEFGFIETWDVELLTARYFYGMSLRQIENDFNYVSFSTIRHRLKKLQQLLVERGFKPRGQK